MSGTTRPEFEPVLQWGLASLPTLYPVKPDGHRVFRGQPPGPEWEGHETFPRMLWTVQDGELVRRAAYRTSPGHADGLWGIAIAYRKERGPTPKSAAERAVG